MQVEIYLGDGAYASFDGWQIKLRAPRGHVDDVIFLEPLVWSALRQFAERCWGKPSAPIEQAED